MDLIAERLRELRDAAIRRRDEATAEVARLDDLLVLATGDLADLLPVRDIMRRLGLPKSTVYDLITRGDLPAVRIGRAVRVPADAVASYQRGATRQRTQPPPATPLPRSWGNAPARRSRTGGA